MIFGFFIIFVIFVTFLANGEDPVFLLGGETAADDCRVRIAAQSRLDKYHVRRFVAIVIYRKNSAAFALKFAFCLVCQARIGAGARAEHCGFLVATARADDSLLHYALLFRKPFNGAKNVLQV